MQKLCSGTFDSLRAPVFTLEAGQQFILATRENTRHRMAVRGSSRLTGPRPRPSQF